jgi:hypothetical protein
MPALPQIVSRVDRVRRLTTNESVRLERRLGLPVGLAADGPFDAVRHIPLPMNEGLTEAASEFPAPEAIWHDLSDAFDVPNLGRSSADIGEADGAEDRPVPVFATPATRNRLAARPQSLRDLEVAVTGGDGIIDHVDPGLVYRSQQVPMRRHVAATQYLAFPLLDILRVLKGRVPSAPAVSPYPEMHLEQGLPHDARLRTMLGPGLRGLDTGFQFDVSMVLSVATLGGTRVLPMLRFPAPDESLGVDGVYCAVARLDRDNLRPYPLQPGMSAPAWGVLAGNFERTVAAGAGHGTPFERGGSKFAPFGATLRTLARANAAGEAVVTGAGGPADPVTILDGLDLAGMAFPDWATPDPNREIGERTVTSDDRAQRFYPQRRIRITLSFATLPQQLDFCEAADGGPPVFGKTAMIVQASLVWLETDREFAPGAAPGRAFARWQARLMRTPRFLDLAHPTLPGGERNRRASNPDEFMAAGLYAPEFDHAIVVGGFSSFGDARRGLRLRLDEVQVRHGAVPLGMGRPFVLPGVDPAVGGTSSRPFLEEWNGPIDPMDSR